MKITEPKKDFLSGAMIFVMFFVCAGWYFAEADNELLRQELAAQKMTQPIHHNEGK